MRKAILRTFQITVVALWAWLISRQLIQYDFSKKDFAKLFSNMQDNMLLFFVCVALMPLNWFIEAKKWQTLLLPIQKINIKSAWHSVMMGLAFGVLTPWRSGEMIGRLSSHQLHKLPATLMLLAIGSAIQFLITVGIGIFFLSQFISIETYPLLCYSCAGLIVFLPVFAMLYIKPNFKRLNNILLLIYNNRPIIIKVSVLSLLRYTVYVLQWAIALYIFSVSDNIFLLMAGTTVSLFLQTISPALPLFDIAVRGGISLLVFSSLSSNPLPILMSSLIIWLLNIVIPSLAGIFILLCNFPEWKCKLSDFGAKAQVKQLHA
ncbi:MAG: hypothetical protein RMJ53_05960 [Chitinophagales bacterium]|nr:hypothetical protein [Chitinophagales bacterium]MDW8273755.1 hypothetical protein [Chitinophagales bacterium]